MENKKITITDFQLTDIQGLGTKSAQALHKLKVFTPGDLLAFDVEKNKKLLTRTQGLSAKKILEWKKSASLLNTTTTIK